MGAKDQILSVGRAILLTDGLRGMTTDAIARRARVSKKTLYRLFPSKSELMETILVAFLEENLSRWDDILDSEETAIERILASLAFVSEFLPRIQAQVINQVAAVAPGLWQSLDAIRMKRLIRLQELMQEAQSDGYLRSDVDSGHWVMLLIGAIRSVATPQVLLENGISLLELFRSIRTIFYDGLLTDAGKRYIADKESL